MSKSLASLINSIGLEAPTGAGAKNVSSVVDDSRQVEAGSIFVAVAGQQVDGHQFAQQAAAAGALAVVGQEPLDLDIPYFKVPDSRLALAQLAAAWYDWPAKKMVMIGVTGTDGKTTTANLLFGMLNSAGIASGMVTTVNAIIGERVQETGFHVTTPPALQVQNYLAQMVEAGMTHCVIEATSHGLAQRRVAACEFDVAVVTNITHEHLDYHGSIEAYRQAKLELFRALDRSAVKGHGQEKVAVLNRDDDSFQSIMAATNARKVSYGMHAEAEIRAINIESMPAGINFELLQQDESPREVRVPLLGVYNVWNCLAAFSAAVEGLGLQAEQAVRALEGASAVPGRMEPIEMGQSFEAIVDFAHTPNALRQALKAARERTDGRLIAVFGSAGLRDREKRRLMAQVSADFADITVLTAEDPRTESLEDILEEMAAAAEGQGATRGYDLFTVPDRGQAIRHAVELAEEADLVIACGKGHEQSMCFGTTEYPWDDRTAMRAALAELLGVPGPAMPTLPTSPAVHKKGETV